MKNEFTQNEIAAMMHENTSIALRRIADFVEKFKMGWEESASLLREIADETEAQVVVVKLRDEINNTQKLQP